MRKLYLPIALFCGITAGISLAEAQSVTLQLGNPANAGTPIGAAPWAAGEKWNTPEGICFDKNGHLWVSDRLNKQIRVQFAGGNVTYARAGIYTNNNALGTNLDDQSGVQARFNNPSFITTDKTGAIYVSERGGYQWPYDTRIRKIEPYTTIGNAQQVSTIHMGLLKEPTGIAVDQNFNIYVADEYYNVVMKFDQNGNQLDVYGGIDSTSTAGFADGNKTDARFKWPRGLAIDTINNYLYVADYGNYRIRRINLSNGDVITVSGAYYNGISGKSANTVGNRDTDTSQTYARAPIGLALGKNNELFFTCGTITSQIRVLNLATSKIRTLAGKYNSPGYVNSDTTEAKFDLPFGIAVAPDNMSLYVTEQGDNGSGGHIIRRIQLNPLCDFTASKLDPFIGENIWLYDASKNRPTEWLWTITPSTYNVDQNNINSQNIRINFTSAGLYEVKFWCKNTYGADSLTRTAYINVKTPIGSAPVANFTAPFVTGTVDSTFSLTDISSNTPDEWLWRVTPNNFTYVQGDSTSQNIKVKFLSVGIYTVELVASNAIGSDNEIKSNYIKVEYPAGITSDNLAIRSLYPNPAADYVILDKVSNHPGQFRLMDAQGKVLREQKLQDQQTRIDLGQLPAGAYIWNYTETATQQSGRLLIVK